MYLKSEFGLNLMVGVRGCEYWRNLKIQGLAESVTLFQFIVMFIFVVYVNWIFFFFYTAPVLKRVVHPLLLPLLCTLSCVQGSQTVIRVYIHLFNVCGVGRGAAAISAAERIVWIMLQLWAEKVLYEPSLILSEKCTLSEHIYSNIVFLNFLVQ